MQFNTLQNVSKFVTQVLFDTEPCLKYKYYEFVEFDVGEWYRNLQEAL